MESLGLMLLLAINYLEFMDPISSKLAELLKYWNGEENIERRETIKSNTMSWSGLLQTVKMKGKGLTIPQTGLSTAM